MAVIRKAGILAVDKAHKFHPTLSFKQANFHSSSFLAQESTQSFTPSCSGLSTGNLSQLSLLSTGDVNFSITATPSCRHG